MSGGRATAWRRVHPARYIQRADSRCTATLPRRTHTDPRMMMLWHGDRSLLASGMRWWAPPPRLTSGGDVGGLRLFCTCRFRSVCGARGGEGSGLACSALPFPFGGRCAGRQGRRTRWPSAVHRLDPWLRPPAMASMADMHVGRGRPPGLPHPVHRSRCYRPAGPVADSYSHGHCASGRSSEVDRVLAPALPFIPARALAVLWPPLRAQNSDPLSLPDAAGRALTERRPPVRHSSLRAD